MKLAALTATLTFVLDQATKLAVVQGLNLIERGVIEIVPPFLVFRMAWNRGINFGLFAGEGDLVRWFLVALSLAITAWVWRWISRSHQTRLVQISAGLLIGGALGNVIDRVVYEAVADFLNMSCCGIENPYAFNVADITIFLGAIGLVLFTGSGEDAPKPKGKGRKTP
ncbi:signal peptidase II [Pseudotabrizicola sp. L79]|uniref:signal peptidase II n=1 Tax=Pseudotabrizicola sp. L79 TaxID=3118402 RepID=UPI002F921333